MVNINKILGLFLFIFLINTISANGLNINVTEVNINKSIDVDKEIVFLVTNEEPFDFANITFEENDIITVNKFSLVSGESKNITAKIISDDFYDGIVTLRGEYETDIGTSNITEIVEIDYDDGFSVCHLNLVKGDTVIWVNNVVDEIKLINKDTGQSFATILEDSNYSQTFSVPVELDYYATWVGFKFTDYCSVDVMDDHGYVHNSEYDDTFHLNLTILYDKTTLELILFEDDYEIEYNEEVEDILKIKNIGNEDAYNVHLEAKWIDFDDNDFNLEKGDSKNIGYTISPDITETDETNKKYNLTVKVTGNFDKIEQNITVFIPYKSVFSSYNGTIDTEVIENFIKSWCKDDIELCEQIYCSVNPDSCEDGQIVGSDSISQIFSEDTIAKLLEGYATLLEDEKVLGKNQLEADVGQTNQITNLNKNLSLMRIDLESLKESGDSLSGTIMFVVILFLFFFGVGVIAVMYFKEDAKRIIQEKVKFHKGEKSW